MDETGVLVRGLRSDFTERDTALFCLLGMLSMTRRLIETVEMSAGSRTGTSAYTFTPHVGPSRFDLFLLGLVSFSNTVTRATTKGPPVICASASATAS